jgi:hypothetical protein
MCGRLGKIRTINHTQKQDTMYPFKRKEGMANISANIVDTIFDVESVVSLDIIIFS